MKYPGKFMMVLLFTLISFSVYAPMQSSALQEQAQPKQAAPSARSIEHAIEEAYRQEPKMHYSRVTVQVTSKEIWLRGIVLSDEAEKFALQVAREHAGGRKIVDRLQVNPNTHPGPGL